MNIRTKIQNVFLRKDEEVKIDDKFSSFKVSYMISNFKSFDIASAISLMNEAKDEDHSILSIKVGDSDAIPFRGGDSDEFKENIGLAIKFHTNEDVVVSFEIKKNSEDRIYIYDFESFIIFWEGRSTLDILSLIKDNLNASGNLNFILTESNLEPFYSQNIRFSGSSEDGGEKKNLSISDNCHFGNLEEYPFNAYFFHLLKRPESNNPIVDSFNQISLLFCIISIFDITSIKDDFLYYKLNGYKSFEDNVKISDLDVSLRPVYFKIFDWIYSEESKVSDKIGLARNIISLSLKEESLSISDSVYLSIQSGYKAYLQENISKYIEIRNKIVDELSWISQKAGDIAANYLSNYQKSIFTFLSFFISVFLLRFLKGGEIEEVFNKEVTIFSLTFLTLSIIFLLFSRWNFGVEEERLGRKYDNLKNRYTDLLDANDIDRILKDDSEFNYELEYIKKRKRNYTILWYVTIIVLFSTVLCVSSYLNWSGVYDCISEFHCL